jgi:HD-GYP domain-containing protein (c-di-GMP phosphodiesterase class II)
MALQALETTVRRIPRPKRRRPASQEGPPLSTESLLALADRHEPGVRRHMDRTAHLCRKVGEQLGLSERVTELAVMAGAVHDVGKLVLPRELLAKQELLDENERKLMRQHPVAAQRLLECTPETRGVAGIVRATRERYDGFGYPDGLRGKAIPLPARIVAVCDAFDAMTHDRSYRTAMPVREAVRELWRGAGGQFDPKVTGALCEVLHADC